MRFAAVLTDLDGVLIDSMAATAAAWTRWGERHGLDGAAIQAANHGVPARAVIAKHVPPEAVAAEAAAVLEAEVATADQVVPYAGAREVLACPVVAVVTSCEAPLAHARMAAAGLAAPAVVVPADDVERGKPAPDAYLLAAERLGVDPAGCLVLEDAPAGVTAGKAAGMSVWAVSTTHDAHELTAADRVFGDLRALATALGAR
jgi:mannitol-1-/sugar-/sorbitol-6-phosphatase